MEVILVKDLRIGGESWKGLESQEGLFSFVGDGND